MNKIDELIKEGNLDVVQDTLKNPFDNTYWFARMLIQSDKYGNVGSKTDAMLGAAEIIENMLPRIDDNDQNLDVAKKAVFDYLISTRKENTKAREGVEWLCGDLDPKIKNKKDLFILGLTMMHIVVPINKMLESIPNNDIEIAEPLAKAYLDQYGEQGLKDVIEIWDELGLKGCISVERAEIVQGLGILRDILKKYNIESIDSDYIITAFVQEFERRVGQKRKGRGGRSLEDVTGFILEYFDIVKSKLVPEHLRASLEVDKLVKCKDGSNIAISCKRTFRERWKQAFTENMGTLDENHVKEIWHLITYDRDLSENKIIEMGEHRCIIYLSDNSSLFGVDSEISKYIRPMSNFIKDIKKEMGKN